jgi:RAB protein geranylgeranyltransferase component A
MILRLIKVGCSVRRRGFSDSLSTGINLDKNTMTDIYKKFGLEAGTQDFIGHAMALHLDDE